MLEFLFHAYKHEPCLKAGLLLITKMIKFQLLLLILFQSEDMQHQIIRETFHIVSRRDDNVCNFLEGGT